MELLFPVLLVVAFWLLLIRPAQKRQKAQAQLQDSVETGSRVMLTSGFFGTVTDASEGDRLRVEIAPGVEVEVVRGAVGAVVPAEDELALDDPAADASVDPADPAGPVDLDKR